MELKVKRQGKEYSIRFLETKYYFNREYYEVEINGRIVLFEESFVSLFRKMESEEINWRGIRYLIVESIDMFESEMTIAEMTMTDELSEETEERIEKFLNGAPEALTEASRTGDRIEA
jgi:hypothetical protein